MSEIMSPSETISRGQVNKLYDLLEAGLLKTGLPKDPSQKVIEEQGASMVGKFVADFRKRVESISDLIVRRVGVKRDCAPQEAIDATGRRQYTSNGLVVKSMPRGKGDLVEVFFFRLGRPISDANLEKEYELRGLKPADPYSLSAVNEVDNQFAEERPNITHWKNANGKWCFISFFCSGEGEGRVRVDQTDFDFDGTWWFAGIRK
jgi:hypothetical protein